LKLERGHAAPPPISVMNSRRLNGLPLGPTAKPYHNLGMTLSQQNWLVMSEMGQKRKSST